MRTIPCLRLILFAFSFGVAVIQCAQAQLPGLSIVSAGNQSCVLSWPATAPDYVLESAEKPDDTLSWRLVAEPPVVANGEFRLVVTAANRARFFRLRFVPPGALPPDPAVVAPTLTASAVTDLASATAFLYTAPHPIQTGVPAGTIEFRRAAVLRGKIRQRDNAVLSGVRISILNHPEFGQTLSRTDGMFDMAVNGGGQLTVNYEKSGYCPVQRQVNAPWQDYALLPDVVMIRMDPAVTTVSTGANAPVQVARGSIQTDAAGTRRATLIMPAGTGATLVMPNGATQPVSSLNIRATEFTVGANGPEAMPAALPPNSGYTYCVELSADETAGAGAVEVKFDRPLCFYLENFLNFPVGVAVPTGYYDRVRGIWIASENGRVIKILGQSGGLATIDTNGDGVAEDAAQLAVLGITSGERQQAAGLYATGQTLWRTCVTHFTPWDSNWPYGPPPDARPPWVPDPMPDDSPKDDCIGAGSIIQFQSQTLGETLPVTGTSFELNYSSDRVPGRKSAYSLNIPLSGDSLPNSLRRIDTEILVAGRRFSQSFPAAPNQSHRFTWDGRDAYGRTVQGAAAATVRTGYVYGVVYQAPSPSGNSFAAFSGIPMSGGAGRTEVTLWKESRSSLGTFRDQVGGWSLSPHHAYDPTGKVLYLGDGTRRDAETLGSVITTIAGHVDNAGFFMGDGGPATQAGLSSPKAVCAAPDGSVYIADTVNMRIRRVGPNGIITTVAGNGSNGFSGDGGPATQAALAAPWDVAVGLDGSLYIADQNNFRIRRVGVGGIITTVAGNGSFGFSGDDGPATQARLSGPSGVAVAPDGSLYIADAGNRIRRVGPDGIITTVAGDGNNGFSGDGGPATMARLFGSLRLEASFDGALFIADGSNHRIRRIGPDGIITTVAGSGPCSVFFNTCDPGFSGDGDPATQARLSSPFDVSAAPDGSLYIADSGNIRIRRAGPDGVITTLAGSGGNAVSGDGGSAAQAALSGVTGTAVAPDGSLYVVESGTGRIRRIGPLLPGISVGDISIASADGAELYVFAGNGLHLRTLNALTGSVRYQFGYDVAGRLVAITDGYGNLTAVERDVSGNPAAITAPGGQRTSLTVDTNGYLATVSNPANERVQLSYNPEGLLRTLTDPAGGIYRFTCDPDGLLTKDEDPAGGVTTLARTASPNGHTITVSTALGRTAAYQVEHLPSGAVRRINSDSHGARTVVVRESDAAQTVTYADGVTITSTPGPDPRFGMQAPRLVRRVVTLPGGQTETTISTRTVSLADPNNLLSLQTLTDTVTINGRAFTRTYDAATLTMTDTSPEGRQTISTIDAQERVIRQTLAQGVAPITLTCDGQGRVIENRQGAQFWTFAYDAGNRITSRTDAAGHRISFLYDNNDRIIRQTLPGGTAYQFAYDLNGNRTRVIPPGGAAHSLGYTSIDMDASYTPPGAGSYLRAYNFDRQLTRTTLPGGRVTDQSYDAAGRVSGLNSPESVTGFEYTANDPTDRVARITSTPVTGPVQSIACTYNGSLVSAMTASGAAPLAVDYTYNDNFLATGMTLVSGTDTVSAALVWDRDGILTGFGSFTFTAGGPGGALSRISDGTLNTATTYTYDTLARIAARSHQVSGQANYSMQLSYDITGQMTGRIETVNGVTHTCAYTYDPDGQLTEVQRDGAAGERYTYDLNGNRISRRLGSGPVETAGYDGQDRLTLRGTVAYQFDADGFLAQRGSDAFQYGTRGQLLRATAGGQVITYAYDGLGRRVSRTDAAGTTQYLYGDPASHMITALRSPGGALTVLYYDTAGLLFALERGGARFHVATDQAGTPRVVSSSAGAVVKALDHDSFGNPISDSNPAFDLPIGYAGGLADAATGLVHFAFRDYDPASGRWTARDPILFEGDQGNLFVYVGNNPISNRDPLGLYCISASLYKGIGGGLQACFTEEGTSYCFEFGLGVGGGVGVDTGGLEKEGSKILAELTAKCGPIGLGVEASLDSEGCLKAGPVGQISKLKFKRGKKEAKLTGAPKLDFTGTKCSATGKLAGKVCRQFKF